MFIKKTACEHKNVQLCKKVLFGYRQLICIYCTTRKEKKVYCWINHFAFEETINSVVINSVGLISLIDFLVTITSAQLPPSKLSKQEGKEIPHSGEVAT